MGNTAASTRASRWMFWEKSLSQCLILPVPSSGHLCWVMTGRWDTVSQTKRATFANTRVHVSTTGCTLVPSIVCIITFGGLYLYPIASSIPPPCLVRLLYHFQCPPPPWFHGPLWVACGTSSSLLLDLDPDPLSCKHSDPLLSWIPPTKG